eukprot:COSAG05_NODE_31_length_28416_cov_170.150652_13_plen_151_part_00
MSPPKRYRKIGAIRNACLGCKWGPPPYTLSVSISNSAYFPVHVPFLMIPIGYNVWEMYGKSLLFSPRNVHFTLSKMTIANQTQLTSICFGCDRAALSASSLVGEFSVTLRDLPRTLFGSLASNAAPIRYNLRIVTDIAIVGPRTLATAGA